MTVLIKVDIKDELPPDQECLFENYEGEIVLGTYDKDSNSALFDYFVVPGVTHWYRKVELPSVDDIKSEGYNESFKRKTFLYQDGFEDGAKYILNQLKFKN